MGHKGGPDSLDPPPRSAHVMGPIQELVGGDWTRVPIDSNMKENSNRKKEDSRRIWKTERNTDRDRNKGGK